MRVSGEGVGRVSGEGVGSAVLGEGAGYLRRLEIVRLVAYNRAEAGQFAQGGAHASAVIRLDEDPAAGCGECPV